MTWQSSRSPCSPARPSQCSTAGREPSTTTTLPPSSNSNTFASLTPPPERAQLPPPPPSPREQPPSVGTYPPAVLRLKARLQIPAKQPSWPARACLSPARTWPATCVKLSVMPTSTQRRRPLTRCRSSPPRGRLASWVTEFLQLRWAGRGNCGGSWVFERVGATLREAESPLWAGRGQRPLRNCREEFLQREERRETTKD